MKKLLLLIIIVFVGVGMQAQFKSASLTAAGLTCAMCTKAINKSLEKLSFIHSVKADIKNSAFNISFKEGSEVDFDALRKRVEDAGFSVAKLKITGNFNQVKVQKDAHVKIGGRIFHFLDVSPQMLNGEQTITIVDKNFVTTKEFKKYSTVTSLTCLQTGKAANCCIKEGISENTRIYHVTI